MSELKKASKKGHRKAGPLGIPQGYGPGFNPRQTRSPGIAVPILEAPWRKKTAKHLTSASTAEAWFRMQVLMEI